MSVTVVVGVNWGDEGKGRMVDYLARNSDVVVRFQGGNNAGHTVVNDFGLFKLHLVPSGIFWPGVLNVLGPGMVIDLEGLSQELDELAEAGVDCGGIRVSDRATICFPFHSQEDALEESRLGAHGFGSTKRGIAPAYSDRYAKKAIQLGELADRARLRERVEAIVEWKNAALRGLYPDAERYSADEMFEWANRHAERLGPHICDTTVLLENAVNEGKRLLLEAQLGALRDLYFGIYPYTTSSTTLAAHAPVGAGLFGASVDRVVGVMKAFSTCVGEGPFVTEMPDDEAASLREVALEYGAATGRPRRIGHFDVVASRYGANVQGATELALTKLDSLSGRETLRVCVGYRIDGRETAEFPLTAALQRAEPVYEELAGWEENLSDLRSYDDLPEAAKAYVVALEQLVGRPIKYVSVGPEREALILRERALVGEA